MYFIPLGTAFCSFARLCLKIGYTKIWWFMNVYDHFPNYGHQFGGPLSWRLSWLTLPMWHSQRRYAIALSQDRFLLGIHVAYVAKSSRRIPVSIRCSKEFGIHYDWMISWFSCGAAGTLALIMKHLCSSMNITWRDTEIPEKKLGWYLYLISGSTPESFDGPSEMADEGRCVLSRRALQGPEGAGLSWHVMACSVVYI